MDNFKDKFTDLSLELNELTELIAKTNSRVFAIETVIRKLNAEEYLTNNYAIKSYVRVCEIAMTNEIVVERISNSNIQGKAFRQLIEIISDSTNSKTTNKEIIENLCLAIETEEIYDD